MGVSDEQLKETVLFLIEEQKALRAKLEALQTLFFAAASFVPPEQLMPLLYKEIETIRAHDLNSQTSDATIEMKARQADALVQGLFLTIQRIRSQA
jgi:hypothetical protein